jgi:outer membrane receptor protein involved in Fe transport
MSMRSTFEARLSGRRPASFDWTWVPSITRANSPTPQQVSHPAFVPTALLVNGQNTTSSENLSGFAHGVFHVTDKLSLTAGVRYSTDQKDEEFDNSIVVTQLDTDENHFDWKAGIDYKFSDSSWRTRRRRPAIARRRSTRGPSRSRSSWALTVKRRLHTRSASRPILMDNRLRVNVAAFYVDYNQRILPIGGTRCLADSSGNYLYIVDPNTPGASQDSLGQWCADPNGPPPPGATTSRTFYNNIPATIQGAELEVQWVPVDG